MKIKIKNFVFAGIAAAMFAGNAMANEGDLDPTVNPTHVTAKSYVDRVVGTRHPTIDAEHKLPAALVDGALTSADMSAYDAHIANGDIHVTAAQKTEWSGKQNAIADYAGNNAAGVVTNVTQTNGAITATKAQITDAEVASGAAIAQSKIDGLTDALAAKATNAFVGTLPQTATATTVTGYIDEAAQNAGTAAISGLDMSQVGGNGNVVMTVSQADGQVSATAGKIANANVADNAAIAQSKIDGLTDALAAKANNDFVGTLPAGAQATTVTGYIDEAVAAAASDATSTIEGLDLTQVGGNGNVVMTVSQADGQVAATAGKIADANVADNAAIAQSKIDGLTHNCSSNAPCAWINNAWVPIQQ